MDNEASFTMVKFVESDSTGLPRKRKQVSQACEKCRQRKKRCTHTESSVLSHQPLEGERGHRPPYDTGQDDVHLGSSPRSPSTQHQVTHAAHDGASTPDDHPSSVFIGDMSPGSVLMEATNLCSHRDTSSSGGVGTWQTRLATQTPRETSATTMRQSSFRRATQDILASYLWNHCLPGQPPAADYAVLERIYLEKLNPLIPFFDDSSLSNPPCKVSKILMIQVISLAAATDPEASRHLRLGSGEPLRSRQDFCSFLSNSVLLTLDSGLVTDRIWVMRLSAALAYYYQPLNPEDADTPSLLNSRAVHQMQTLGTHMASTSMSEKTQANQTLFCVLWALDRIISAFYGRACLIHERDVGWDMEDCIRRQDPPFRLLLVIVGLLEKVIALYRPKNRTSHPIFIDMPIYEQMILDADALKTPSPCLASLEILYHAIAILSSQSPADGDSSALGNPATNSRRSLSADRITQIVGSDCNGQLAYMPIIPYGVSLSLNVSYRKMRHSKVPMFRSRGRQSFQTNMSLLKSMDDTFWSAKPLVAMAEQVLQEMDKAVACMAQENGLTECSKRGDQPSSSMQSEHPQLQVQASRTADNTGQFDAFNGSDVDWMLPDLDVFGYFDPTFDLGAFDAALEGNLDFGQTTSWLDWHQSSWG